MDRPPGRDRQSSDPESKEGPATGAETALKCVKQVGLFVGYFQMQALGKHIIAELYDCDKALINDHEFIEEVMLRAVEISGATIVRPVFHKFNPHGVSGVVVIAESHFSIHTWPEYGYCALDIFTCGDEIDNQAALSHLKNQLKAGNLSVSEIKRGVLNLGVQIRHKPEANRTITM